MKFAVPGREWRNPPRAFTVEPRSRKTAARQDDGNVPGSVINRGGSHESCDPVRRKRHASAPLHGRSAEAIDAHRVEAGPRVTAEMVAPERHSRGFHHHRLPRTSHPQLLQRCRSAQGACIPFARMLQQSRLGITFFVLRKIPPPIRDSNLCGVLVRRLQF